MVIALDLDGVLCDLGPCVASRIADRFGVATHPSSWRTYDLRLLRLGVPERSLTAFLDEVFDDPALYDEGAPHDGASHGVRQLLAAGWRLVGITARPAHLAPVTRAWLARHGFDLDAVHHTPVGTKAAVARAGWARSRRSRTTPSRPSCSARSASRGCSTGPTTATTCCSVPAGCSRGTTRSGRLCQLRLFA